MIDLSRVDRAHAERVGRGEATLREIIEYAASEAREADLSVEPHKDPPDGFHAGCAAARAWAALTSSRMEQLLNDAEAAEATVARLREALTWHPIETAKPSGAPYIGWAPWFDRPCEIFWLDGSACWGDVRGNPKEPTHWMALPKAPTESALRVATQEEQ